VLIAQTEVPEASRASGVGGPPSRVTLPFYQYRTIMELEMLPGRTYFILGTKEKQKKYFKFYFDAPSIVGPALLAQDSRLR
jgi:hypothetical protein